MAASPTTSISFQNFFSAQLTADITASDVDIPMDAIPNGSEGFLVIEPDSTSKREIIYYTSKTALKVVCPSAGDGRGQDDTSATTHASGSTVIMAPIAAYFELLLSLFTTSPQGWTSLAGTFSVASGYAAGNKSYTIDTTTDQSAILQPGMRFKLTRGTAAPTQCFDAESGSSHYADDSSVSGLSFTDDYTLEAWIKLESYGTTVIVSRDGGGAGRFQMYLTAGRIVIDGQNAAAATDAVTAKTAVPLGRWVHVAAAIDMSGATGAIYYDGVAQPTLYTNGAGAAMVQAGNIYIGRNSGGNYFDGKIADVRIWSAVRTQTQIRDNMHQQLVGNESNLVGYWKLAGNFNDSTSNANNLTAQNSAVATNADHPFQTTEYGIITKVSSTQIVVFTGTDYSIPNMTLSSPSYSTYKAPFGFNANRQKWMVETIIKTQQSNTAPTVNVWYSLDGPNTQGNFKLQIPQGDWIASYDVALQGNGASPIGVAGTLSTANNAETDARNTSYMEASGTITSAAGSVRREIGLSLAAATDYYFNTLFVIAGATAIYNRGEVAASVIRAECAYI